MTNDNYTVWVGGIEVNDTLMSKEEAVELVNLYSKQGYMDVCVGRYSNIPPQLKSYLWQEFHDCNHPKYYHLFDEWYENLTTTQIAYQQAYFQGRKTIVNDLNH